MKDIPLIGQGIEIELDHGDMGHTEVGVITHAGYSASLKMWRFHVRVGAVSGGGELRTDAESERVAEASACENQSAPERKRSRETDVLKEDILSLKNKISRMQKDLHETLRGFADGIMKRSEETFAELKNAQKFQAEYLRYLEDRLNRMQK